MIRLYFVTFEYGSPGFAPGGLFLSARGGGGGVNGKSRTGRLLDAAWWVGCVSLVCYSLQLVSYFVQTLHNAAALLWARVFNAVGVV